MLSVAIAYVVCCIFTCCLLQLPMLSVAIAPMLFVAIAYVVCCNCLCCLLQLPMLSVAIAYVVRCNCLCCPLQLPTVCCHFIQKLAHHVRYHLHNHSTKPKTLNPPPQMCPDQKQKSKNVRGLLQWCGGRLPFPSLQLPVLQFYRWNVLFAIEMLP